MREEKSSDRLSIVLSNFWEELFPKVQDSYAIPKIIERIKAWSGDQPAVTEILCNYVCRYASQIDESDAAGIVDRIVFRDILKDWRNSMAASHLNRIETVIREYEKRDVLLLLYMQILQRGSVPAEKSPEQEVLLSSGLVTEESRKLKITNRLYAKVFDLAWVEKQLPGITRPVTIVKSQPTSDRKLSFASALYPKIAIAACFLAVAGAALTAHLRAANTQAALATQDEVTSSEPAAPTPTFVPSSSPPVVASDEAAERALFDRGVEHATNGRWLPMAREFCSLPKKSTYYMPAQKQIEKWVELYHDDIEIARDTYTQEQDRSCAIMTDGLIQAIQ
ncbi:MAG: hypothetical protein AAFQ74_03540 [Cyanobacteria bacterium J06623_4]